MQKHVKWLLIGLFFAVLPACTKQTSTEAQLRTRIAAMQQGLESQRPAQFLDGVAEDFVGNAALDRAGLERLVKARLLMHQDIGIQTGPLDVQLSGDTAVVHFQAVTTGSSSGRWLPETGRISEVETHWRHDGDDWVIYRASW